MENKSLNKNLHKANRAKNDEFYTQLPDIENELKHYKDQFRGKVVYCNCDDPFESNFFKYFAANFKELGLKKLIATSFSGSPITGKQLSILEMEGLKNEKKKEPLKIEITEVLDSDKDGAINIDDVKELLKRCKKTVTPLKGGGDFRSEECIGLLKQADIICTNPPFSLFREYVAQLVEYKKKFLIIGNDNAVKYKEIFPLIVENRIWRGYTRIKEFRRPNGSLQKFGNVGWFTNLDMAKRHEKITLYKKYIRKEYPEYDNYDAVEVSKISEIPMDYDGVMGVPITFIDKYNPDQFEIIGISNGNNRDKYAIGKMVTVNNKSTYARILIKKR
ncbi:MAG TPA: adenine-specific methyltransferase EcoRI family protein [Candidatus Colwellbacteria bacterium]|nr:adenine-specific methyltransferase EcoRI family protein [Candidatus Colwellbacteria bacterium]